MQRTGSNWSPLATGQIMQPLSACMSSQPDLISNIAPGVSIPIIISRSPSSKPTPIEFNSRRSFGRRLSGRSILSVDLEEKKEGENWGTNRGDGDDWQIQFIRDEGA